LLHMSSPGHAFPHNQPLRMPVQFACSCVHGLSLPHSGKRDGREAQLGQPPKPLLINVSSAAKERCFPLISRRIRALQRARYLEWQANMPQHPTVAGRPTQKNLRCTGLCAETSVGHVVVMHVHSMSRSSEGSRRRNSIICGAAARLSSHMMRKRAVSQR